MIITFDDSLSLALKCQYAKDKGLSGVMIWEITQDVIGQNQPLTDVVGAQMMTTSGIVAERLGSLPDGAALYDNYPNAINPTTHFGFRIVNFGFVSLKVFDALGREIATVVNDVRQLGTYTVQWDGSLYPSGVYFYRLQTKDFVATKRMLLIK